MRDDELFKFVGPLAFKAADKFFKFVSWAIIITLIKYARTTSNSTTLTYLEIAATTMFTLALLAQTLHLAVRDPADWNTPDRLRVPVRIAQIIVALGLLLFISSPFLLLDGMIEDLAVRLGR